MNRERFRLSYVTACTERDEAQARANRAEDEILRLREQAGEMAEEIQRLRGQLDRVRARLLEGGQNAESRWRAAAEALHLAAVEAGEIDADVPVDVYAEPIRAVVATVRPAILREAASLLAEDARHRAVYQERANQLVTQGIEDAAVLLEDHAAELEEASDG